MTAEKAGIAATAIITDRFIPTAQAMAQVSGMPGYPFVTIAHPIAHNDDAVLREKAADAVRQSVALLVRR